MNLNVSLACHIYFLSFILLWISLVDFFIFSFYLICSVILFFPYNVIHCNSHVIFIFMLFYFMLFHFSRNFHSISISRNGKWDRRQYAWLRKFNIQRGGGRWKRQEKTKEKRDFPQNGDQYNEGVAISTFDGKFFSIFLCLIPRDWSKLTGYLGRVLGNICLKKSLPPFLAKKAFVPFLSQKNIFAPYIFWK